MKNWLVWIGIIACAIYFFVEKNRPAVKDWYVNKSTPCVIIDKQVRQENASSDSRNTQMKFVNHLFVRVNGYVVDRLVSDQTYWSYAAHARINLMISYQDIYGYRNDHEEDGMGWAMLIAVLLFIVWVGMGIKRVWNE